MANYYDNYWDSYKKGYLQDFPYKWPVIRNLIPTEKSITILDFGCGTGKVISEMRKINTTAQFIGIDVADNAIKTAKKKNPNAKFFQVDDGGKLPLKKASVDFILASDVIEHVYNTESLLHEFNRVLKPTGSIVITTPYFGFIKNFIIICIGFDTVFDPVGPHIRFYSKSSLLKTISQVGFVAQKFGYFGRFFPVWRGMYVLAGKSS